MSYVPPNEAEKRVMDEVMRAYQVRNDIFQKSHGGASIPSLTPLFNLTKNPGRSLYEINVEVIARKAKNFRASNTFLNRLLAWNASLRGSSLVNELQMNADGGTIKVWLEGIVDYYKDAMVTQLTTLGGDFKTVANESRKSDLRLLQGIDSGRSQHQSITDDELSAIMDHAQSCLRTDICTSPELVKVLRLAPEFLRSYQIAIALGRTFADYSSSASSCHDSLPNIYECVLEDRLRSKGWLFFFFSLLLAALRLHHMLFTDSSSSQADGAAIPSTLAALTEGELRASLHAVTELLRFASSDRTTTADVVNATSLRYVRAACMISFPPAELVRQVDEHNAELAKMVAEHQSLPILTAAQYAEQPLFRMLTKDIPELVTKMEVFMTNVNMEKAWVTAVMMLQLFRFDPKKPRRVSAYSAAAEASDVLGWKSKDMIEYDVSNENKPRNTYLFDLLVTYLRPIFRQLLLCEPPRADAEKDHGGGDNGEGSSGGENSSGPKQQDDFVMTMGQMEARQALAEVALSVSRIVIPYSTKMRRWNLIGVGEHVTVQENFGEACLQEAIGDVLNELMTDVLLWTTKPPNLWNQIRETPDKTRAVAEEEVFRFFKYLIRTEKYYNALTDASVVVGKPATVDGSGGDAAGPVNVSITILQRYKEQYYSAVNRALATIYPSNASLALILPVVNATHNYLLRQEEANGCGVVGGATAGTGAPMRMGPQPPTGVKAVKKAPPPGPPGVKGGPGGPLRPDASVIMELRSEEDFKSALRLVHCIESTDFFFSKYKDMLQLRLSFRPPPNRTRDEAFDAAKRQLERGALDYLSGTIGERRELKDMRAMADGLKPVYFSSKNEAGEPGGGTKLVVNVQDWRTWGIEPDKRSYLIKESDATQGNGGAPHMVDFAHAGAPTQSEPLPFPRDLWAALSEFQNEYQGTHNGKVLRWFAPELCQSTFSLVFPKDGGRPTTIHGTLLMQQIFLAISQYRREGVSYATLANRASNHDVEQLRRMLAPLVERDKLLVVVNKGEVPPRSPEERIALNYEFTRPPQNRTGEFNYWLGCKRMATAIDENEQREMRERRVLQAKAATVQVMKSLRTTTHNELFTKVSEKVSREFQLSAHYFKMAIESLIEQNFIERDAEAQNGAAYKYKA